MSRTDKHQPWWVQERDPWRWRHGQFRADHDHSGGACDFQLRWDEPDLPWSATSCHIAYAGHRQVCGCRMCTWYWGRRLTRRRGRHDEQRLCRALAKDPGVGEDLPGQIPVKELWWSPSAARRGRREPME